MKPLQPISHALWHTSRMAFPLLLLGVVLLFTRCGVADNQLRVSGKYANFDTGDFLIISTDGGLDRIDTLHLEGGEFDYLCDLGKDAQFVVIYPDNRQLPLWASGGDHIEIKGDAQALGQEIVSGNEENELFTEFRQQNVKADTVALRHSASQFIRKHPANRVSQWLLLEYFALTDNVPADSVMRLYEAIHEALPQNNEVASLGGRIKQRFSLVEGNKMPAFDIVTGDSVRRSLATYRGKNLVLFFWAGWQGSSSYQHHELLGLKEKLANPTDGKKAVSLELLGYSLDVDTLTMGVNMGDYRQRVPTYCDYMGFASPLASQLGIHEIPTFVIVGTDGKVKRLTNDLMAVKKYFDK